jgi:hypothetical protein
VTSLVILRQGFYMSNKRKFFDDLEASVNQIKRGEYPELVRIEESLLHAKQRRILTADKQRKLQIKNINELYEYDLLSVESQFRDAYESAQQRLIGELKAEADTLENDMPHSHSNEFSTKENNQNVETNYEGTASVNAVDIDSTNNGSSSSTVNLSMTAHEKSKDKTEKLHPKHIADNKPKLDYALPVATMRSDFSEIVSDLQNRAETFKNTAPKYVKYITDRVRQILFLYLQSIPNLE